MKNESSIFRPCIIAACLTGIALAVSCSQSAPVAPAAPPPPEVGRFQIVVATEGEHSVLLLMDTKEGTTWIYRAPQGPAVNGFWNDIPRVTYGADVWQRVFTQMAQQPVRPSSTPGGTTNGPAPVTAPSQPNP